jgi:hypothetical protein
MAASRKDIWGRFYESVPAVNLRIKLNSKFVEIVIIACGGLKTKLNGPGGMAYVVVIESAYRTEDHGFESRQGVRFLGIYILQCCCHNLICIVILYLQKLIIKN